MSGKTFAYVFACLLILQVLAAPVYAGSTRSRSTRMNARQIPTSRRDYGKQYAVASNGKILVRKSRGNASSKSACAPAPAPKSSCGCAAPKKGIKNDYNRTYETVGLCDTTIDVVSHRERSVDFVATQCLSFQTLKQHNTKYNVLRNTNANQRYVQCQGATIEVLTTVCKTVQTLVCLSVSVDVVATQTACVQSLSCRSAIVKNLEQVQKNIRVVRPAHAAARRVTSAHGKVKNIHRVHQRVSQSISRSVTCPSHNFSSTAKHSNQCAPSPKACAPVSKSCAPVSRSC